MIEEIDRNLYRLEIPLPQSPLRSINSYVIKSAARNLLIDSGLNRKECKDALFAGLASLGVDLNETDFFITHLHSDHLALAAAIAPEGAKIYFNAADAGRVRPFFANRTDMAGFARLHGMPEDEITDGITNHPGVKYGVGPTPAFHICKEGDAICVDDYRFVCLETPGHSFGHMCLYEPHRKYLLSGDHILGDITPNIQTWFEGWNPLVAYLASLDKTYLLDVQLVLPGHRRIFRDCRRRIEELKQHHETRAREVLAILDDGRKTAYEVASRMTWDIVCDSWDTFPVAQKWFALGEAIAHLVYLESLGDLKRETTPEGWVFTRTNTRHAGNPNI
jgi:glyoxylase-like metal-dependent hydrolase (beta-lactamase superfamily II)